MAVKYLTVLAMCTLHWAVCSTLKAADFTSAVNCFSSNALKILTSKDGNLISSPYSADVVMSMLLLGSGGETEKELSQSLQYQNYQLSTQDVENQFKSNLVSLSQEKNITLNIANSIWSDQSYPIKADYKKIVTDTFLAQQESVDFRTNAQGATNKINAWVNTRTNNLISKIFNDGDLDSSTVLVLLNAIYFKGDWAKPFDKKNTKNLPFFNNADKSKPKTVPQMNQIDNFLYKDDSNLQAQILAQDYEGKSLSFVMILPHEGVKIQNVMNKITCSNIGSLLNLAFSPKVNLTMPKFDISSDLNLVEPLQKLNIATIFSGAADLSGIGNGLQVTKVVQKARIKVDEIGSEAAAVTGGVVGLTAVFEPPEYVQFNADRPFLFYIVKKQSGQILFAGKLNQF